MTFRYDLPIYWYIAGHNNHLYLFTTVSSIDEIDTKEDEEQGKYDT